MKQFFTFIGRIFFPLLLTIFLVGGTVFFDSVQAESTAVTEEDALIHAVLLTGENLTITGFFDGVSSISTSLVDTPLPQTPFSLTTGSDTKVELTFGGRVSVRVDGDSVVQVNQVVMADDATPHVVVELVQGRLYATNALAGGMVDIYVNSVLVMPAFGAVTITYPSPDTFFTVDAVAHSAHVAFLRPDWRQFLYSAEEPLFLNLFTLTEGYRTTIDPTKITSRINSLRVSKLVKEFPVSLFTTADDPWAALNAAQDYADIQSFQKSLFADFDLVSLVSWYTTTSGVFHDVVTALTVMPDKIAVQKTATFLESYATLFSAVRKDDSALLETARADFLTAVAQAESDVVTPFIQKLTADFMSVLPSSALYPVKETLRSVSGAQVSVVAGMLRDVESLLSAQDATAAQILYTSFVPLLHTIIAGSSSLDDQQTYSFVALKTAFDGLLYRYAGMQTEENYAPVLALEDLLISTSPDEIESAERRQTFVATRLQLFKRLLYLGKNKVSGVAAVIAFGSFLLETTEDLYVAGATTVAVNTYFAQELSSASDWLRFFQSPEFVSMTAEDEVQTVFQEFLAKEASQSLLLSYVQSGSSANSTDTISIDDALNEATELLQDVRIDFDSLIPLYDSENRLFSIQGGVIKGVSFTADYDRITDLLYKISIQDQSYNTGVLRKNFPDFVAALVAGDTYSYTGTEAVQAVTEHSILERVAIQVVLETFEMIDLVATDDHVLIVDLEKQQFTVENVQFRGSDALFSFDYSASDKQVSNLSVRTLLGPTTIDGTYGLDELENLVETTYNAASSTLFGS